MQEQAYDYDKLTQATTQLKQVYTKGDVLSSLIRSHHIMAFVNLEIPTLLATG
jgi:hypothetical protein